MIIDYSELSKCGPSRGSWSRSCSYQVDRRSTWHLHHHQAACCLLSPPLQGTAASASPDYQSAWPQWFWRERGQRDTWGNRNQQASWYCIRFLCAGSFLDSTVSLVVLFPIFFIACLFLLSLYCIILCGMLAFLHFLQGQGRGMYLWIGLQLPWNELTWKSSDTLTPFSLSLIIVLSDIQIAWS